MGLLDFFKDIDVKDKVGDFWELVDDPVKNTLSGLDKPRGAIWGGLSAIAEDEGFTLGDIGQGIVGGFKHPELYQPDTGNRLLDIGLSAALDPLTYIPAANLTKARYLKPLTPLLAPVAGTQASLSRRVGAELATNIAARAGSEAGTELTKGTPLESIGGVAGGLLAGGVTASRVGKGISQKIPEDTQLPKMTDDEWQTYFENDAPHIADSIPSTIKKYKVNNSLGLDLGEFDTIEQAQEFQSKLTFSDSLINEIEIPNPFAPEFTYVERDIPIYVDKDTQVITRGQLVFLSKEEKRFAVDPQQQAVDTIWDENAVHYSEIRDPNVKELMASWEGLSQGLPLRQAFRDKDVELLSSGYDVGGEGRAALHEISDDGYVTLYRGESTIIEGKYTPQFEEGQVIQSMSSSPAGAAIFTHNIENPGFSSDKIIMKARVPIDDIFMTLRSTTFPHEHEFLVIDRNKIDDNLFKEITGIEKPQPREVTYEVFNSITSKTVSRFKTEAEAKQALIPQPLSQDEAIKLDELAEEVDNLNKELTSTTDLDQTAWLDLHDEFTLKSAELRDLRGKANSNNLDIRAIPRGTESVKPLTEVLGEIEPSPNLLGFAGTQQERNRATQARRRERSSEKRAERKARSSLEDVKVTPFRGTLEAAENIVPIELTKQNAGNELVESVVGEPAHNNLEQTYLTPPASGIENMDKYRKILTDKGIDKRIAANLESLSAKERKDIADVMVNEQGAHGIPEDLVHLIVEGYEKAGKTDPTHIAAMNNALRGMWATADGSWFGIQGLLTIPRLLVKGDIKDAYDVLTLPMLTLAGNKTAMTKWLRRTIENLPEDAPPLSVVYQKGLHLAFLKGNSDFNFTLFDKLPFFKPDAAFMSAGDVARISMFYNEWMRYGAKGKGSIEQIATAVNRATGVAESPFGGQIGSFAFFAPRFFQSQLETIAKAFTDGTIEGTLARRQLLALVGTGTALTFAANYARGEETVIDPRDPNFLRIRNIAGNDISVFGPWDSLAKLVVHIGSGDLAYARTKFGPLASLMTNIIAGETFIGDPVQSNPYKILGEVANQAQEVAHGDFNITDMDAATKNSIKTLVFPFAWQQIGRESLSSTALNFFGVKNSPLSRKEIIEVNMTNLGLDPNDPLDRRQYLTEHPEYSAQATEVDRAAADYRVNILDRQQLNEDGTADDSLRLVEFRENRKMLSRELRAKLEVLFRGRDDFKADTPQKKWIASYFDLFAQAQDPISRDIIGQEFDRLQAQWLEANGEEAFDYINRYLQIGKGDIELQYLNDMRELDKLGYFDTQKFDPDIYRLSGLTDKQIEDYRDKVSAARSVNPDLANKSFKQSMRIVFSGELTEDQIWAIDKAGSESYANEEITRLKELSPHLFQWFNPNSRWSNYLEAKGESVELPAPVLAIPRIR